MERQQKIATAEEVAELALEIARLRIELAATRSRVSSDTSVCCEISGGSCMLPRGFRWHYARPSGTCEQVLVNSTGMTCRTRREHDDPLKVESLRTAGWITYEGDKIK